MFISLTALLCIPYGTAYSTRYDITVSYRVLYAVPGMKSLFLYAINFPHLDDGNILSSP